VIFVHLSLVLPKMVRYPALILRASAHLLGLMGRISFWFAPSFSEIPFPLVVPVLAPEAPLLELTQGFWELAMMWLEPNLADLLPLLLPFLRPSKTGFSFSMASVARGDRIWARRSPTIPPRFQQFTGEAA
jgi:hypothetical protein